MEYWISQIIYRQNAEWWGIRQKNIVLKDAEEIKSVSEELSDTELESISGGAKYCILPTDDGSYIVIVG